MQVIVDLSLIPPAVTLVEPDDFTAFKVVVQDSGHARVPVSTLKELAGDRADDPEWSQGLEKMLAYAEQHGWVNDFGVRAHIEQA